MPFVSRSQWRALAAKMDRGEIPKATFDEFAHATPGGYDSLPERKTTAKKTQSAAAGARVTGGARRKATAPAPIGKVRKISSGRTGTGTRSRNGGRR